MKENLISFCMLGVFKNSLRYVYGLKCLSSCKSDLVEPRLKRQRMEGE